MTLSFRALLRLSTSVFVAFLCKSCCHAQDNDVLYFETIYNDLLVDNFYRNVDSLSSPPSPNGAIGDSNKAYELDDATGNDYFLEQQRYGADWIAAGIVLNDFDSIETGRLILEWALDRSAKDSNFFSEAKDAVHSTSLFLEACTRAALLLLEHDSSCDEETSNASTCSYQQIVESWIPQLVEMADFVASESIVGTIGRDSNLEPFAHRYFLRAAGLQGTWLLLINSSIDVSDNGTGSNHHHLSNTAQSLVEEGLLLQTPDGIFPERGGFDFNYQGIGLCYLGRWNQLMLLLSPNENGDNSMNQSISNALLASRSLFFERVDSLGNINTSDSSRIHEVARSGRPKKLDYKTIAQGFLSAASFLELIGFSDSNDYYTLATLLANPNRPIVEYLFEGTADGQKSTGVDDTQANLFCRTANNAKNPTPLGDARSGLTSTEGDRALALESTTDTMGGGKGPFCRTDGNVDSLDGLRSFTLSGYYKVPQNMTGNIELFKTHRMKLTVVNDGKLRLFVDSHSGSNSVVSSKTDWNTINEWGFFAVTYDGTQSHDNVVFYSGLEGILSQSSTQTLNKGSIDSGSSRLYINRQNRPMVGYLDNMRIYGSKTNDSGVMSYENIRDLYAFDIAPH